MTVIAKQDIPNEQSLVLTINKDGIYQVKNIQASKLNIIIESIENELSNQNINEHVHNIYTKFINKIKKLNLK